jgi:PhnB protein
MITALTPHIVVRGAADAADWYRDALGATVGDRIAVPDGRLMQVELHFGSNPVAIADEFPEFGAVSPQTVGGTYGALTITCDDADALFAQAITHGAVEHQPLQDAFWGERHGQILDPFGHRWGIASRIADVPAEEIQRLATELFTATE